MSLVTVLAGAFLFCQRHHLTRLAAAMAPARRLTPDRGYELGLAGMLALAEWQTRLFQNGRLRRYLLVILLTTLLLIALAFLREASIPGWRTRVDLHPHEGILVGVMLLAVWLATRSESRLAAIVALGTAGYGLALLFVLFGAPDLAMTQFMVETLLVVLFLSAFYRLPRFTTRSSIPTRIRDAAVASAIGGFTSLLTLIVTAQSHPASLRRYFAANSLSEGKGRNVVNTILVDFRALDTLGEITVLAIAAVGVYALLKLRSC